jgi:hypothetical protein
MSNIGGVIKSLRDIFRKDPGLSGDAQRIEQLGWMIFLKLFDDKDKEKEILDRKYKSPIPSKFQWRNWAEDDEGITGDELIDFINNHLFPALKNLKVAADNRLGVIIRNIFDGTNNYMKSGTTFRQAINKLNEIDFNSSKEHHIFNAIYNPGFHAGRGRAPLILIGAGTGIGPLAGIIRANIRRRPVHLFFGMRHPDSDFLYDEDLPTWQAEGRLTQVSTAVSRGARPHYVQDALRAEAAHVAEAIGQGAKVMVCGGREMAQGVARALEDILAPMGLTPAMLKAGGRYVEDVY